MDENGSLPGIRVTFWGVRGSIPVAGANFQRFGGNTPCVEIRLDDRLFVIDAGSGILGLGLKLLESCPTRVDVLLSHLHLDHVMGLPFFKPALLPDREVGIYCGNLGGNTAEEALRRVFSPPIFPVTMDMFPARMEHIGFHAGETLTLSDGFRVRTCPLNHPQGATGYRFDHRGRSVTYLSDLEHLGAEPDPALVAFAAGSDLVIYDAMFSDSEYGRCIGWGHSTWTAGVALAKAAGVGRLALFHHDPRHDDATLAALEAEAAAAFPGTFAAREGGMLFFAAAEAAPAVAGKLRRLA